MDEGIARGNHTSKHNCTPMEEFPRYEQSVSKSMYSQSNSCEGGRMRTRPRPSKDISRSELRESAEKRNHSRLACDQVNSRLKARNIGGMRQHLNQSVDRPKRRENGLHANCQQWPKQPANVYSKASKQQTLEAQSQQLLQLVSQKENILKDLDNRIEMKMSEWLLFEAEVNRKMTSYTTELSHVADLLKAQKQELAAIRARIAESQETYNSRNAELNRRKQEVEELCRYVEQTTRDQDYLKCQLEAEKSTCRARLLQCETTKKELEAREKLLAEAEERIHSYEDEILESMSELEKRERELSERNAELAAASEQNAIKEQELEQRQRVISVYVNQLNSCISGLTNERSELLSLGANLERRCSQLESIELKLYRRLNDDSNELDRYLTDSTNLSVRTPIKSNAKENVVSAFTDKHSRKKEERQQTIEERSSDLLEDSPREFDRLC